MILDAIKILIPSVLAFVTGILFTPFLTSYLYRNEMWKKKAGKVDAAGNDTPIFNALHQKKEVGTPRMGGIVIWASAAFVTLAIWLADRLTGSALAGKLDFLSRSQTWIPLTVLLAGAVVGLVDDYLEIKGSGGHIAGGLSLAKRLAIVGFVALLCAGWFYFKLEVSSIGLPLGGSIPLGIGFIPFFIIVALALYSGGVIDGIDGLAGGIFASMFAAYGGIAAFHHQTDLAAFCAVIVGSILAFLWFNIPPARYYMSETGSMALTITLAVVAFMTDSLGGGYGILVLPIIAIPLVITTLSVIIQTSSKKFRKKKVFLVAPLHHHFEALGWPSYKVTMRYWIIGIIFAALGLVLALVG